jgi:hypothetical protein
MEARDLRTLRLKSVQHASLSRVGLTRHRPRPLPNRLFVSRYGTPVPGPRQGFLVGRWFHEVGCTTRSWNVEITRIAHAQWVTVPGLVGSSSSPMAHRSLARTPGDLHNARAFRRGNPRASAVGGAPDPSGRFSADLTGQGHPWYCSGAEAHASAQGTGPCGRKRFGADARMRCVAFRRSEQSDWCVVGLCQRRKAGQSGVSTGRASPPSQQAYCAAPTPGVSEERAQAQGFTLG